jgi:hypothetical protein
VATVRDELERSPGVEHVVFALKGAAAYEAFEAALRGGLSELPAGPRSAPRVAPTRGSSAGPATG